MSQSCPWDLGNKSSESHAVLLECIVIACQRFLQLYYTPFSLFALFWLFCTAKTRHSEHMKLLGQMFTVNTNMFQFSQSMHVALKPFFQPPEGLRNFDLVICTVRAVQKWKRILSFPSQRTGWNKHLWFSPFCSADMQLQQWKFRTVQNLWFVRFWNGKKICVWIFTKMCWNLPRHLVGRDLKKNFRSTWISSLSFKLVLKSCSRIHFKKSNFSKSFPLIVVSSKSQRWRDSLLKKSSHKVTSQNNVLFFFKQCKMISAKWGVQKKQCKISSAKQLGNFSAVESWMKGSSLLWKLNRMLSQQVTLECRFLELFWVIFVEFVQCKTAEKQCK